MMEAATAIMTSSVKTKHKSPLNFEVNVQAGRLILCMEINIIAVIVTALIVSSICIGFLLT